ncbi:MAG: hypothetical protein MK085_05220, partial [Phycisphaerales bacterium]|nr:hypothetical protein [Phycisphaerales bacterium]
ENIKAVARCRAIGLRVEVIPTTPKEDFADRIDAVFENAGVQLVCLAGYLRYFRVDPRWTNRAINIHPSLLPAHGGQGMYGERVHKAVLAAGDQESGCTVHVVDGEYDHGTTILQRRCPVLPDDDADRLASRVFAEECLAMPEAVAAIANGDIELADP